MGEGSLYATPTIDRYLTAFARWTKETRLRAA